MSANASQLSNVQEQFISVTLEELLNASIGNPERGVLSSMQVLNNLDLTASLSLRTGKSISAVEAEMRLYHEALGKMQEKYGDFQIVQNGPKFTVTGPSKDRLVEAQKEHDDLLAVKVSIAGSTINVAELDAIGIRIAPVHLSRLGWLIIE